MGRRAIAHLLTQRTHKLRRLTDHRRRRRRRALGLHASCGGVGHGTAAADERAATEGDRLVGVVVQRELADESLDLIGLHKLGVTTLESRRRCGKGRAQSRRRCGKGGPSPGADVAPFEAFERMRSSTSCLVQYTSGVRV